MTKKTKADLEKEVAALRGKVEELRQGPEIADALRKELASVRGELGRSDKAWRAACQKLGALVVLGDFRALTSSLYDELREKAGFPREDGKPWFQPAPGEIHTAWRWAGYNPDTKEWTGGPITGTLPDDARAEREGAAGAGEVAGDGGDPCGARDRASRRGERRERDDRGAGAGDPGGADR